MCIVSDLIFQYLLKHCSHVKLVVLGCEHKATEMMPNQLLELTWNCMTAQKCLQNAPVLRGRSWCLGPGSDPPAGIPPRACRSPRRSSGTPSRGVWLHPDPLRSSVCVWMHANGREQKAPELGEAVSGYATKSFIRPGLAKHHLLPVTFEGSHRAVAWHRKLRSQNRMRHGRSWTLENTAAQNDHGLFMPSWSQNPKVMLIVILIVIIWVVIIVIIMSMPQWRVRFRCPSAVSTLSQLISAPLVRLMHSPGVRGPGWALPLFPLIT